MVQLLVFSDIIPTRHILCFMFVIGFICVFMIRVSLNLTIVGMVKQPSNGTTSNDNETAPVKEEVSIAL